MRGDEREGEIRRSLDVHLGKAALHAKLPAIEQKQIVRVRMPRDDGPPTQHGNVNIRVRAANMLPKWKIQPVGLERRAQFQKRVGRPHFLEREHVRFDGFDAFSDFGLGLVGFGVRTRCRRLVQIVFHVVSGDAEGAGGEGSGTN